LIAAAQVIAVAVLVSVMLPAKAFEELSTHPAQPRSDRGQLDALGEQGRRIAKNDDHEVWVKPAESGVGWEQLGYPRHHSARLRDL
jgi:hypothetical protein